MSGGEGAVAASLLGMAILAGLGVLTVITHDDLADEDQSPTGSTSALDVTAEPYD
ncbi:hypothetical protein [Streptomyces qinzhouensis]|uniref:hypothetical protein n=1 Tax=Streptomyces qinzhouensis TaxID=2599401 RepID=UPI0016466617|nr:hypothetical protein [Streptomyces qinzhouensis]